MISPIKQLWFIGVLLLLGFTTDESSFVQASLTFKESSNQDLVEVDCPSTQITFVAITELVLQGRNQLLSLEERNELSSIYGSVYNNLTQQSCDSYFRRIANLTFVNMTNTLGESEVAMTLAESKSGRRRKLSNTTSTSIPGVDIVYEVTGTCRECPLDDFELYDDASGRRALLETLVRSAFHLEPFVVVKPMRILQQQQTSTVSLSVDVNDDCLCVNGTEPTEPQAPAVEQFVTEINVEMDIVRVEKGLFGELNLTNVMQLEEPPPPTPSPSPSPSPTTAQPTAETTVVSSRAMGKARTVTTLILSLGAGVLTMNVALLF